MHQLILGFWMSQNPMGQNLWADEPCCQGLFLDKIIVWALKFVCVWGGGASGWDQLDRRAGWVPYRHTDTVHAPQVPGFSDQTGRPGLAGLATILSSRQGYELIFPSWQGSRMGPWVSMAHWGIKSDRTLHKIPYSDKARAAWNLTLAGLYTCAAGLCGFPSVHARLPGWAAKWLHSAVHGSMN